MDAAPLQRVSTVEALVAAIRREVVSGMRRPGSQLRETELSDRFGAGRQSVRSALQALVHAGLLRHEPNRGVFVPTFSRADVEDIHLLRSAIETEAAAALIARGAATKPLDEALARLERLSDEAGWDEAVDADLALHSAIVAGSGSRRLMRAYEGLLGEQRLLLAQVQDRYPRPLVLGPIHRRIVDEIRAGKVDAARRELRAHLDASRDEAVEVVSARRP